MILKENQCSICSNVFNDPRWMPCKHIYCFKCIPQLYCYDLSTHEQLVLQCRICLMRFSFRNWSTVKYYATLHCVPYLTALQFDQISRSIVKCSCCFRTIDDEFEKDLMEFCMHCNRMICHQCLMEHRMELKKNILKNIERYRYLRRKCEDNRRELMHKLQNLNIHVDCCADQLIDQIDIYAYYLTTQIDEQQFVQEKDLTTSKNRNISLIIPSITHIQLLGELISSHSFTNSSTLQILWTMTLLSPLCYLLFEPHSSKLLIYNQHGYISIYSYTKTSLSLIDSFCVSSTEQSQLIPIKSLTASKHLLFVIFTLSTQSIVHLYSHHGHRLHTLSFFNEYLSQIRFDDDQLWCLELISSSLFYFPIQSNEYLEKKIPFISFKDQSFNPFRFALNQTLVAIIDRALTGILRLYHRHTAIFLKQINCPSIDSEPHDIELTNRLLIYRFSHLILLFDLETEQYFESISNKKIVSLTIGKSSNEVIFSTSTENPNRFLIQSFLETNDQH